MGPSPWHPTQNGGFVSRQGGGMTPPTCDTKPWIRTYKICIMRTSGFVSQARGGLPPPSCDTKPRFCVAIMPLDQKVGFRHLRHARSSRLVKSASFDETKLLGGVGTQNGGLGNQFFWKSKKYAPTTAKGVVTYVLA